MDRRQFCTAGATALSLGAAGAMSLPIGRGLAAVPPYSAATAVYKVVFDERHELGRSFGAAAARRGVRTGAINGDVTALWLHDLRSHWARGGGAVAGLTTMPALFSLEQMAKDHWLPVTVRILHRADAGYVAAHRLTAASSNWPRLAAALADGAAWPERVAEALIALAPAGGERRTGVFACTQATRFAAPEPGLVSWVIGA